MTESPHCMIATCKQPFTWKGTLGTRKAGTATKKQYSTNVRYCDDHADFQRELVPMSLELVLEPVNVD